jgi:hypothetical protein
VSSPNAARPPTRLAHQAFELVGDGTTFIPRPPPPEAALIITG